MMDTAADRLHRRSRRVNNLRHISSIHRKDSESLGKDKKCGLQFFFVVIEAGSVALDMFKNNWKPSLAAFFLSLFGFAVTLYVRCEKRNTLAIKPLALRQLGIQEIALSGLQLIATLTHLLAFVLHRKKIYDVSVLIPLGFAITAFGFAFYEGKEKVTYSSSGDLSIEQFLLANDSEHSSSTEVDLIGITVDRVNSVNNLRSRSRQVNVEGPRIEEFQIFGEAKPGGKLFACGHAVNGTTLCTFQWVRVPSLSSSNWQYIEGATNPEYVITADDVDKLIALECIPIDDQGRQGDLVRVFANKESKIKCDLDMQSEINMYVSKREATFRVQLLIKSSTNWEPATFILNWPSCQVKIDGTEVAVIREIFSEESSIQIPTGISTQFILRCSNGASHLFSAYSVRMRDIVVLTMRMLQNKVERLPPYVKFRPTDEMLVFHYLTGKVSGQDFPFIKEIPFYKHEPSEFSSLSYDSGHEGMYFFTQLRFKNGKGLTNRRTKGGIWKVIGKPFWIQDRDGNGVAKISKLVYYKRHPDSSSESLKTVWMTKEYKLLERPLPNQKNKGERFAAWALYVVYSHRKHE